MPERPRASIIIVLNLNAVGAPAQENSEGPSLGWKVHNLRDGYLVSISYGVQFSIALQDLQLISDVNPLRVDSVVVRSIMHDAPPPPAPPGDIRAAGKPTQKPVAASSSSFPPTHSDITSSISHGMISSLAPTPGEAVGGCVIVVKVLDQHQPVRITESEVVRVKKRHRGFFSSVFGTF